MVRSTCAAVLLDVVKEMALDIRSHSKINPKSDEVQNHRKLKGRLFRNKIQAKRDEK